MKASSESGRQSRDRRESPSSYLAAIHAAWLVDDSNERWREFPGTFVFADVSGFTALAERLARRGRVGAEVLSDAIDHVFAALIVRVGELGGDVLKFGGDALLIVFHGDEHAARGCAAAVGMQEEMAAIRRRRAISGAAGLRISIGVASGTAHLFLAGDSHRELVVTGPLATEVVGCEGRAEAGEVRVSPATASAIGAEHVTPDDPAALLLTTAPPVGACEPPSWPVEVDTDAGLPSHLHDHIPGEAEHRAANIAFLQFRGTEDVLRSAGPGALSDELHALITDVQRACLDHGVTFVSTDVDAGGGKVILITGAPRAFDDDADRLLLAVRDVLEVRRRVSVRAGVNCGRVFVVDIGAPQRHVWTIMGDTVNLAARIMGHAGTGQLLAECTLLDRARDDFARTSLPPFFVKGKTEPVNAEVIGSPRGAASGLVGSSVRLIGREKELQSLLAMVASARMGEGAAIELIGEPGIGKSSLVHALIEGGENVEVTLIQAGPYAAMNPFFAIREPLRVLILGGEHQGDPADGLRKRVAERAPALLPLLPLIGIPVGLQFEPTSETRVLRPEFATMAMHDAIGRLVEAVLPDRTWLLVVEDGHLLDGASADLLAHVIRRTRDGGNITLITRRDVSGGLRFQGDEMTTKMRLGPLSSHAVESFVAANESPLPPNEMKALVERAAGNPLFLEELLAAAKTGETIGSLPESIEGLLSARIDTLPRDDRAVLRQAAVLGTRTSEEHLETFLGWAPGSAAERLTHLHDFLLDDGGEVHFRHALIRDAAYEALPFRRRHDLHAQAAEMIERRTHGDESAELLSIHFHAAQRWIDSWRWSRTAGEQALRHGAPAEAAAFLEKALDAGRRLRRIDDADLAVVAERLGDAANLAARYEQAAVAYRDARRRRRKSGEILVLAELCRKEGRLRERSDRYAAALSWYTRGLKMLDEVNGGESTAGLRARLIVARGAALLRQGRLQACLPVLEKGATAADEAGDRATLAHAYYLLDWALTDLGHPDAHRYRSLALPIYEELDDFGGQARVLNNLGIDAYYEGRWNEAVDYYEQSRRASERVGDVVEVATAENNIAEIRCDQGRYEEAEKLLQEALATWRAAGFRVGIGLAWSNLGRVAYRRGNLEPAAEFLGRAKTQFEHIGAAAFILEVEAREAERLLLAGDHVAALPLLGSIRERAQTLGAHPTLMSMLQRFAGYAKLQSGDVDSARIRFTEALDLAGSVGAGFEIALAQEALGGCGGPDAERLRAAAAQAFERLGVDDGVTPALQQLEPAGG